MRDKNEYIVPKLSCKTGALIRNNNKYNGDEIQRDLPNPANCMQ